MNLLHANDRRGIHAPSWYAATCRLPAHPPLERHVEVDVCVIGGGFTGLSAAATLAARGHSVALLEAHRLGWGASGRNGGQLGTGYNAAQDEIERQLGRERAHALWDIAEEAKRDVHALAGRRGIDLQYRAGIVTAQHRARTVAALHRDCEFLAREYGLDVETLDRAAVRAHVASEDYHGGALDRSAGHLHPLRLIEALAREASASGVRLHEGSEVLRIEGLGATGGARRSGTGRSDIGKSDTGTRGVRATGIGAGGAPASLDAAFALAEAGATPAREARESYPAAARAAPTGTAGERPGPTGSGGAGAPDRRPRVVTATGSVRAERIVLAGNGYLDALAPREVAARVMPINNFILVTEPLGERAAALLPGNHAVADSRFVVNYFRRTPDDRLLFGGGESYGYRFPRDMARRTRRAMLGVFPELAGCRVDFSWGGTLAITRSRLPHVARLSPRLFSAGGYSGHGVGLAVATGRAIGEAIDGDADRLELLSALPSGRFPGGPRARPALLALAMSGAAWLDRL